MKIHHRLCAFCGLAFDVDAQHARRSTCSPKCQFALSRRNQYGTKDEQFWSKVNKTDGCWEWTGTIMRSGYGHFSINNRYQLAHRISYKMHFGAIPPGLCVLHQCDNRRCVRPEHLFLGTKKDNAQDAIAKDRFTTGERNGVRKKKELHKITDAEVSEIIQRYGGRKRYERGNVTYKQIANDYGVSKTLIIFILQGKRRLLGRST